MFFGIVDGTFKLNSETSILMVRQRLLGSENDNPMVLLKCFCSFPKTHQRKVKIHQDFTQGKGPKLSVKGSSWKN